MSDEPIQPDDRPFPPFTNGDGRDERGRFVNRPGPGAPCKPRSKLGKLVTDSDDAEFVEILRTVARDDKARPTDRIAAIKELWDRKYGRPVSSEIIDRLEQLTAALDGKDQP